MKNKLSIAALAALLCGATVATAPALARDHHYDDHGYYDNHHVYHRDDRYYREHCGSGNGAVGTVAGGAGGAVLGNVLGGTSAGGGGGARGGRHFDKKNPRHRRGG